MVDLLLPVRRRTAGVTSPVDETGVCVSELGAVRQHARRLRLAKEADAP